MDRLTCESHDILTEALVEILNSRQIFTVGDFARTDPQQICRATRLPFREVLLIRKSILNKYSAAERNGYDYFQSLLKNSAIVSTGIPGLDLLMDGGFFTGNVYELCGLAGSGKTQFCLNLVKHIATSLKQTVYYLDTKGDFSAKRVKNMLDITEKTALTECLSRIMVQRIQTRFDLYNSLHQLKEVLSQPGNAKTRVIIIDSLPAILLESSDRSDNNGFLNHLVNIMRYISNEYHIAFLVTNLITTWNDGDFRNVGHLKETISCGKYWYNIPNVRLKIEKNEGVEAHRISVIRRAVGSRVQTSSVTNVSIIEKGLAELGQ